MGEGRRWVDAHGCADEPFVLLVLLVLVLVVLVVLVLLVLLVLVVLVVLVLVMLVPDHERALGRWRPQQRPRQSSHDSTLGSAPTT